MVQVLSGQTYTANKFLLNDCDLYVASEIAALCDARLLSIDKAYICMDEMIRQVSGDFEDCLVVYPGEGSLLCKDKISSLRNVKYSEVYAKRWLSSNGDPVAQVGQVHDHFYIDPSITRIVVVDDVLASGATMLKLHQRFA